MSRNRTRTEKLAFVAEMERLQTQGCSLAEIARRLGIARTVLCKWRNGQCLGPHGVRLGRRPRPRPVSPASVHVVGSCNKCTQLEGCREAVRGGQAVLCGEKALELEGGRCEEELWSMNGAVSEEAAALAY